MDFLKSVFKNTALSEAFEIEYVDVNVLVQLNPLWFAPNAKAIIYIVNI